MGLLDTIKSVLGLGSTEEDVSRESTDVAVEYEPDEENEAAVKGADESAASGTDAAASTGSMTEEPPEDDVAAEPAEAAGAVTDHEGTETPAAEPAEAAGPTPEDAEGSDTLQVTTVSGVGPAYAERLAEAGVETVADLAAADPEELAGTTDISEKRLRRWQESAYDVR